MKGRFIVLEGLDGAGLSTQAVLLGKSLREKGFKTLLTKEPTNGMIGGMIKAALSGEWKAPPRALQLLFCADRAYHLDKIITPALDNGMVVISDRYLFSTLAYGYASSINYKWLRLVNLNFRLPDLGVLIDVKPETAVRRLMSEQGDIELFEKRNELAKVKQAYINVAREFHLKKVDGEGSVEEVGDRIYTAVSKFLGLKE